MWYEVYVAKVTNISTWEYTTLAVTEFRKKCEWSLEIALTFSPLHPEAGVLSPQSDQ